MKTLNTSLSKTTALLIGIIMIFALSCKKDSTITQPTATPISITNVQPKNPLPGDVVTITGRGFGATLTDVKVTIGAQTITITTVTDTEIKFTLPTGITAGDIAVAIKGIPATNNDPQKATITPQVPVVVLPTIISINPTSGKTGDVVSILGTGFATVATDNVVKFNGITATVTGSVTSVLTVTVPAGVSTGAVSVSVKGGATITGPTFTVTTTTGGTGTAVPYITSVSGTATFSKIATAPAEIGSMVVDKANNTMYYSDYTIFAATHTGNIYKMKLDGSAAAIFTTDARITKVVNMTVDATGNVYAVASLDNVGGVQANIYKIDATTQAITVLATNINYAASGSTLNVDSQGGVWLGYGQKLNSTTNVFDRNATFPYGSLSNPITPGDNIYVDDVNHLTNSNVQFYKYNLLTKVGTLTDFTLQGLFKQDDPAMPLGTDSQCKYTLDNSENFYAIKAILGDVTSGSNDYNVIRKTKNGNGGASTLLTKFYVKPYSSTTPIVFYTQPRSNTGFLFASDATGNLYIKANQTDIIKITY